MCFLSILRRHRDSEEHTLSTVSSTRRRRERDRGRQALKETSRRLSSGRGRQLRPKSSQDFQHLQRAVVECVSSIFGIE